MAVGDSEGRVWIYDTGEVQIVLVSFEKKMQKRSAHSQAESLLAPRKKKGQGEQCRMPGPPRVCSPLARKTSEGPQEVFYAKTTSAGSSQCDGAAALLH